MHLATLLARIKPAERWGTLVGLVTLVIVATGVPDRFGVGPEQVAAIIAGAILVAPMLRGVWQAWRAGDLAGAAERIEAVVSDPRVAEVFREAVGKAAVDIAAAKVPDYSSRPIVERHLRPPEPATVRETISGVDG